MRGSGWISVRIAQVAALQKCVQSLICIGLDQTKQTVSGCLTQFGHVRTLACRSSLAALPTASDVERRRSSPASQREKTRGK